MVTAASWPSPRVVGHAIRGLRFAHVVQGSGPLAGQAFNGFLSDLPHVFALVPGGDTPGYGVCENCLAKEPFPPAPQGTAGPLFSIGSLEYAQYATTFLYDFRRRHAACIPKGEDLKNG